MTKEKVLEMVELKKTRTADEIAKLWGVSLSTVNYWLRKARGQGLIIIKQKSGPKPLNLTK